MPLSLQGYAIMMGVHALPGVSDLPFHFCPIFITVPPQNILHIPGCSPGSNHTHRTMCPDFPLTICTIFQLVHDFPVQKHMPTFLSVFIPVSPSLLLPGGAAGSCVPTPRSRRYGRAGSEVPWGNLQSTSCYYPLQQNNQHGLCNAVRWIEAA